MNESSSSQPASGATSGDADDFHFEYSTVAGYFLQDDTDTDPSSFNFTDHAFGIIERSYPSESSESSTLSQWQRFQQHLSSLNAAAPGSTSYHLLFLARHGQGYHNVGESYYGSEMWDCYWSTLEGNKTVTWADARLTSIGKGQAKEAHDLWKEMIAEQKIKTPDNFYVSPLDRAIETANITFSGIIDQRAYKPTIKEMLREGNGVHTCDRRSSRSVIASRWPNYTFEDGFSEDDDLWKPDLRESYGAITERLRGLLDDVFEHDSNTCISMTAHSGTIMAILHVVQHRPFPLQTGGVIPVLVRVEKKPGKRQPTQVEPWHPKPECSSDPLEARASGFNSFEDYWQSVGIEDTKDPRNSL